MGDPLMRGLELLAATCQYGSCTERARLSVTGWEIAPQIVLLCDAHVADWGIHWRDGHSRLEEVL